MFIIIFFVEGNLYLQAFVSESSDHDNSVTKACDCKFLSQANMVILPTTAAVGGGNGYKN